MNSLLLRESDYILLVLGALTLFGLLHGYFWRGKRPSAIPLVTWLLVLGVLGGGWFLVEASGRIEVQRMRQMVAGYAPTFAQELARMGHEQITLKTSPEDPRYWQMISAQKRWLKVNPSISDIYTLRKLPDGQIALIVDSETDYDHDGRFDGEREARTPIGEIYRSELKKVIETVLAGQAAFRDEPYTDRWGTWVTAAVPIRNFRGDVEAVLGVDFDAAGWVAAAQRARMMTIGYVGALLLIIAAGSGLLQAANRDLDLKVCEQEGTSLEKEKLETLIESIDGIVWEADPKTFAFTFVSPQCERILGYPRKDWMAVPHFRKSKLHRDGQWTEDHCARTIPGHGPYSYDYQMTAADGRTVWIRENASVLRDAAGEPLLVRGVFYDITAQKRAAEELEEANERLVDSSRFAGMAEVATGVLHNVGNVLNSVNISGGVISERLRGSKVIELGKVAGLLTLQKADFIGFVTNDPRGPHIPELISRITDAIRAEQADLLEEVESITKNIGHIKEIVSMQQGFAKGAGIVEPVTLQTLVDDAIKINADQLSRHRISVVQAYEDVAKVEVDKHLVLQILVNLLRNAQQAIESSGREERRIVVRIQSSCSGFAQVTVKDSGSGIPPENLTRIFSHGFTTKKTGHGFGLHSSALAAKGMGGALAAHSDGPGTGATFSLDLPIFTPNPIAAAA